ncbi:probable WRKY transcription factor 35 [Musa acuminata AAA Group]|uniref:probable WRKY transcription factor 35 n=1 Tax=Musa acuminata AAA Group TaxID=214697 RepID=UPI0031E135E8
MFDYFWQRMESDQGDLADIVRSGGFAGASGAAEFPVSDQKLPSEATVLPSPGDRINNLGDPFGCHRDPLLHSGGGQIEVAIESSDGGGGGMIVSRKLRVREEIIKACDINHRAFRVSSGGAKGSPLPPNAIVPTAVLIGEMTKASDGAAVGCSVDDGGMRISSTRTLGIKRRKNQVKKVVCIPAPTAATNRHSGEVVPYDLWAWRKYGQKPIKGSPYPRGYYRCSSSKGCTARKQVERSPTNPNMLVITYTSEHNHAWPTQRNALAGSTRSQASKNAASASKTSGHDLKEDEPKETATGSDALFVKGEVADKGIHHPAEGDEYDGAVEQSWKPAVIPASSHPDDFFADLAELETDPMSLIFSNETKPAAGGDVALDPSHMFDSAGRWNGRAMNRSD